MSEFFGAIAALSQFGLAIAAGFGVWVAWSQLKSTRISYISRRQSEIAEEAIVLLKKVEDAFRYMRNPFSFGPRESMKDKEFFYRQRYERISESNDLFSKLREVQIRADALVPGANLEVAVGDLLKARTKIATAIDNLADIQGVDRYREEQIAARKIISGTWSPDDVFGTNILSSIESAIGRLEPFARFR